MKRLENNNILCDSFAGYVTDISMLRHYRNVNSSIREVAWYYDIDYDDLKTAANLLNGSITIGELKENISGLIEDALNSISKKEERIRNLHVSRTEMCGIGTRKVKLRLNKLSKSGKVLATAYRIALEAEDKNIVAKETDRRYVDKVYYQKECLLESLSKLCKEYGWVYGEQDPKDHTNKRVVYFELPGCRQISFHCDKGGFKCPEYEGVWDGEENSTIKKLDDAIYKLLEENDMLN